MGVREHNAPHETSVGPNTAHNYVNDRLCPTRAITPEVELPDRATTSVTETGSLNSPSCESDYPWKQSQDLSRLRPDH